MPRQAKRGGKGEGGGEETEKKTKKKEEKRTLLEDKLQTEKKTPSVNPLKLNQLHRDIDIIQQTFERELVDRDNVIKGLRHDLKGTEHQSAQVQWVHLQNVKRLGDLQEKRLMLLQQLWEDRLQCQSSSFKSERKQMLAHSRQQRADLEDAELTLEQQYEQVMNEIHRLYSESIASYQSNHEDRKTALVLEGVMVMNTKIQQEQDILELHHKEEKELDNLVLKTQQYIRTTDKSMRRVKKLQDSMVQLRIKLKSTKSETESMERNLPAARNEAKKITHKLRDQLTESQMVARKQLTVLTVQSSDAIKKLQAVIAKGKRVSRVAELCLKHESKQQNVLSVSSDADGQREVMEEEEAKESCKFAELWHVMRHSNATLLHREALKIQNKDLRKENQQLRLLLHPHMSPMMGSDHTLRGLHTLLTVPKAPISMAPSDTHRRQSEIGAVHVVKQTF
nr:PREDICTED: coiled-coil domain-containing protein 65-like [Paralichthys olivaceus]